MAITYDLTDDIFQGISPRVALVYLDAGNSPSNIDNLSTYATNRVMIREMLMRPVLGLQYLAGTIKSIGYDVVILDNKVLHFNEKTMGSFVEDNGIILVGFYASISDANHVSHFIGNLKKFTNVPVVVGGPGYLEFEMLLNAGADVVCKGEGEKIIVDVLDNIDNIGSDLSNICGIAFKHNGEIKQTKNQELLKLDDIPFPLRDNYISVDSYYNYLIPGYRHPFITMITNRGCPHNCIYCDSPNIAQNAVRRRNPDNVLEEIDYAVKNWDIRYIDFLDDIFGVGYNWVEEFCTKLAERNYDIKYKALVNPSTFGRNQDKAFAIMANSGCNTLGIGMQSADEDILKFMHRQHDSPERLISAVQSAKSHGIMTFVNFIVGFPNEPADIDEKINRLLDRARPTLMDCYGLWYIKGTELYELRKQNKIVDAE